MRIEVIGFTGFRFFRADFRLNDRLTVKWNCPIRVRRRFRVHKLFGKFVNPVFYIFHGYIEIIGCGICGNLNRLIVVITGQCDREGTGQGIVFQIHYAVAVACYRSIVAETAGSVAAEKAVIRSVVTLFVLFVIDQSAGTEGSRPVSVMLIARQARIGIVFQRLIFQVIGLCAAGIGLESVSQCLL